MLVLLDRRALGEMMTGLLPSHGGAPVPRCISSDLTVYWLQKNEIARSGT